MAPEAKFIVPDWGDKVHDDIGLSYRPARLHRLAGWYDSPLPESTFRDYEFGYCESGLKSVPAPGGVPYNIIPEEDITKMYIGRQVFLGRRRLFEVLSLKNAVGNSKLLERLWHLPKIKTIVELK
jgi:hypothetical protein